VRYAKTIGFLALFWLVQPVTAAEVYPVVQTLMEFKGEDVRSMTLYNGETRTVKAGAGLSFLLGVNIFNDRYKVFHTEISIGHKNHRRKSSVGHMSITRYPIEIGQYMRRGQHHLGIGLTYHVNPELDCRVRQDCNDVFGFKNAFGQFIHYEYALPMEQKKQSRLHLTLGLRYTYLQLKADNSNQTFDGSGIGLSVGFKYY
jgi:hypothetical protein